MGIKSSESGAVSSKSISLCKNCWCMTHTIDGKCSKCRANEATIILKTAMICEARGIDEAMKYYNGTHSENEYQEYRTSVILPN